MAVRGALLQFHRERRPLALLAALALAIPMLFGIAGLHRTIAATVVTDGGVVICTADGATRANAGTDGEDRSPGGHDLACCLSCTATPLSAHALPPVSAIHLAATGSLRSDRQWSAPALVSHAPRHDGSPRAPPIGSV